MPLEEVINYKVNVDQQSMRESLFNLQSSLSSTMGANSYNAAMNLQSPYFSQNAVGVAQAGVAGFNTVMQDLSQARAMLPSSNAFYDPGMVHMGLGQSILGQMGIGTPSTMRFQAYQQLAREDFASRMAAAGAEVPLGLASFGARFGLPLAAGATGYMAGGASGAFTAIAGIGLPAMGLAMAAGYGVDAVRDQMRTQRRMESILYASSRGRMDRVTRSGVSTEIRRTLSADEALSADEGVELMAYATESGFLNTDQDIDDYTRKYKSLLKSVKKVMQTFHTSVKESVAVMAELRNAGVLDVSQIGTEAIITESRATLAGMSPGQMLGIRTSGARTGIGTRYGAELTGEVATMGTTLARRLMKTGALPEELVYNLTGESGAQGAAAMARGLTAGAAGFSASDLGLQLGAAALTSTGESDQDFINKFLTGKISPAEVALRAGRRFAELGAPEARKRARDVMSRMSPEEAMMAPVMMAIGVLRNGQRPVTQANLKEVLMGTMRMDEAGAELASRMAGNLDQFSNIRQEDLNQLEDQAVSDALRKDNWYYSVSSTGAGLTADVATFFTRQGRRAGLLGEIASEAVFGRTDIRGAGGILSRGRRIDVGALRGGTVTSDLFDEYVSGKPRQYRPGGVLGFLSRAGQFMATGGTSLVSDIYGQAEKREFENLFLSKMDIMEKIAADPSLLANEDIEEQLLAGVDDSDMQNALYRLVAEGTSKGNVEAFSRLLNNVRVSKSVLGLQERARGVGALMQSEVERLKKKGLSDQSGRLRSMMGMVKRFSTAKTVSGADVESLMELMSSEEVRGIRGAVGLQKGLEDLLSGRNRYAIKNDVEDMSSANRMSGQIENIDAKMAKLISSLDRVADEMAAYKGKKG